MSKSAAQTPEAILKKLRRLDANMRCPNCDSKAPQGIGYGNICVKYKTFVCDLCKTSHQAISHRVKSVTMSTWTMEEVRELMNEYGGGNDAARHVWLDKAPSCGSKYNGGHRPKEGDKIEYFKQFVIDCYEHGRFRANTEYVINMHKTAIQEEVPTTSSPPRSHRTSPMPPRPHTSVSVKSEIASNHHIPASASNANIDLLDVADDKIFSMQVAPLSHHASFDILNSAVGNDFSFPAPTSPADVFDPFAMPLTSTSSASSISMPNFDPFAMPSTSASSSMPTYDPFSTTASVGTSLSNQSTTQVSRASSFDDLMSVHSAPASTSANSYDNNISSQPSVSTSNYDPFGNDMLMPVNSFGLTQQTSIHSTIPSLTPTSSSKSGSFALQTNNAQLQYPTIPMTSIPMTSVPMNGGMNSGLAISSMASLLPPPAPAYPQPILGMRPQAPGYPAAYASSPMMGTSYNRPSPTYNSFNSSSMGISNMNMASPSYQGTSSGSGKNAASGAFDFVDAELKSSTKR